jgi:peptide/nickel transport system ATP-binding protein
MGSLVDVRDLTVVAGGATLVDALSFTIRPGEVLALIGESSPVRARPPRRWR